MSDADEVVRLRDENAYLRSLLRDLVDGVGPLIPLMERSAYLWSVLQDLVDNLAPFLPLLERLDEYSGRRNGATGRRRTPPTS